MPRSIDVEEELVKLEKAIESGEKLRRQFVLRLDPAIAIALMKDCEATGNKSGPLLEQIVTHHYKVGSVGAHLKKLPAPILKAVDRAAQLKGQERDDIIIELVSKNITGLLKEIAAQQKELREAIGDDTEPKSGQHGGGKS